MQPARTEPQIHLDLEAEPASASLQPVADRQSRMLWLLDRSLFVCGTDAEQTLHSRCVDVKASGRRYTVIKNSVIACGLFLPHSLFLLFLFSLWAQSLAPLLPSFWHQNPCAEASFFSMFSSHRFSHLVVCTYYECIDSFTWVGTLNLTEVMPDSQRGPPLPPSAKRRHDGIADRGKNPHFLSFSSHFHLRFPWVCRKTSSIIALSQTLFKKVATVAQTGIRGSQKCSEYKELMGMRAFRCRLICIGKLHSKFPQMLQPQ